MKTIFVFLASTAFGWCAMGASPVSSGQDTSAPPLIQVGPAAGRDGAAFGPGISCQVNWKRIGLYGFAGRSSVNGYQTDGVKANFSDNTIGFGVAYRAFRFRRLTVGGYAQAARYGSKVRASYFDPTYETTVTYRENDLDALTTIGPEADYQVTKAISLILRPGKDFGHDFAATTVHGLSVTGSIVFDAQSVVRAIGKFFR